MEILLTAGLQIQRSGELVTWYWKINERIAIEKKKNLLLEKISNQLSKIIENKSNDFNN